MKTKILNTILFTLLTVVTFAQTKVPFNLGVSQTNPTCVNFSDGEITALPSGGFPPYTYQWSNGDTTQTISNLSAGNYSVTVTDSYNSTIAAFLTVDNPLPITISGTQSNVTSFGLSNGQIDIVDISNTTGSFTYQWFTAGGSFQNQGNLDQQGLTSGYYKIMVTDSIGCVGIGYFTISQPNPSLPTLNNPNLISPSISNNTSAISTYPNPSNGNFTIETKENVSEIRIVNTINGEEVYNDKSSLSKLYVDNLKTGIYMIYVTTEKGTETKRITIL
jgi:hypothetical protein